MLISTDRSLFHEDAVSMICLGIEKRGARIPTTERFDRFAQYAIDLVALRSNMTPSQEPQSIKRQAAFARAALGEVDIAVEILRGVIKDHPDDLEARLLFARVLCGLGAFDQGLDQLEIAVREHGYRSVGYLTRFPEFPKQSLRFNELSVIRFNASLADLGQAVWFKNLSRVDLYDVTLEFHAEYGVRQQYFPILRSGEERKASFPAVRKVIFRSPNFKNFEVQLMEATDTKPRRSRR